MAAREAMQILDPITLAPLADLGHLKNITLRGFLPTDLIVCHKTRLFP
jgi:hypothetical protein